MAASEGAAASATSPASPSQQSQATIAEPTRITDGGPIQSQTDPLPTSTPLEMSHLATQSHSDAATEPSDLPQMQNSSHLPPNITTIAATTNQVNDSPVSPVSAGAQQTAITHGDLSPVTEVTMGTKQQQQPQQAAAPAKGGSRSEPDAIGPSSEMSIHASIDQADGPAVLIALLLNSTGTRHPYKIDQPYLKSRGISTGNSAGESDPFGISVYTLKELILRDWRKDWEQRPTSPSSIRLIHFGKLLEDRKTLRDYKFDAQKANMVHMTVKPQEVVDDEENGKLGRGSRRDRRGNNDANEPGCCRCVIQ